MPLSEVINLALTVQQRASCDVIEIARPALTNWITQPEASNTELKASFQFTQKEVDDLKETYIKQDEDIEVMKKELAELKNKKYEEKEVMKKRMNYQEDYSRRNNFRIDDIEENAREN